MNKTESVKSSGFYKELNVRIFIYSNTYNMDDGFLIYLCLLRILLASFDIGLSEK